jgi:hypothetical protein
VASYWLKQISVESPFKLGRIYLATVVLGALVTHLSSEFFGMGADADSQILFSPRHIYLGLAAIACVFVLWHEFRRLISGSNGVRDLKRVVSIGISKLPWGGGWKLCLLTAVLQFAIGVGSAVGEGCFFCSHDAFFGIAGALLTALLLAIAGHFITARLPRLAAALSARLQPIRSCELSLRREPPSGWSARPIFWSLQLANRPPPIHS